MLVDVRDIYKDISLYMEKEVTVQGWVRNHRKQACFGFIDFSDGTCFEHLQLVYTDELKEFEDVPGDKIIDEYLKNEKK